jgi:DnaJ-class molecular chaperone
MAQQTQKDFYMILGCPAIASPQDLQRKYREAMAACNPTAPDTLSRKAWAEKRTRLVMEAFNHLNDEEKRMGYDNQMHLQPRLVRKAGVLKDAEAAAKGPAKGGLLGRLFNRSAAPAAPSNMADVDKRFDKGVTLANGNRCSEARDEFRAAVEGDRTHVEAAYNLALMEYKMGRFTAAIGGFKRVLEMAPLDFYAKVMVEVLTDDSDD